MAQVLCRPRSLPVLHTVSWSPCYGTAGVVHCVNPEKTPVQRRASIHTRYQSLNMLRLKAWCSTDATRRCAWLHHSYHASVALQQHQHQGSPVYVNQIIRLLSEEGSSQQAACVHTGHAYRTGTATPILRRTAVLLWSRHALDLPLPHRPLQPLLSDNLRCCLQALCLCGKLCWQGCCWLLACTIRVRTEARLLPLLLLLPSEVDNQL
jgi:hypothetical protein